MPSLMNSGREMNSNVTVARSPVRRIPCGWSIDSIRTVCRTAYAARVRDPGAKVQGSSAGFAVYGLPWKVRGLRFEFRTSGVGGGWPMGASVSVTRTTEGRAGGIKKIPHPAVQHRLVIPLQRRVVAIRAPRHDQPDKRRCGGIYALEDKHLALETADRPWWRLGLVHEHHALAHVRAAHAFQCQ